MPLRRALLGIVLLGGIARAAGLDQLKVPFYPDRTDQCGPSTLAGILSFWGHTINPVQLRKEMYLAKLHGTLPMDLVFAAQAHGLKAQMVEGTLRMVKAEIKAGRPVLAMLDLGFSGIPVEHYVIVTGYSEERQGVYAHSAGTANQFMPYSKFLKQWEKTDFWAMIAQPL
jgi:ABC-type bacteriocin/lantibiotic exporter with double-glycine peptidase domain